MVRLARIVALSPLVVAVPAAAQERVVDVDIPATTAGEAIRLLGRQGRVSIGVRDASLLRVPVASVRGRYLPQQVLERLFAGTAVRVRRVADASFVVERAPARPVPVRGAAPPRRAAPPALPPEPLPAHDDMIVVTATKRDVPLSAYAGGAEILDGARLSLAEGARGTDAIEARASSVTSTHLGPGRNKLFIRGIADSSFVGPTQATVGQYWGNSRITYSAPDPSLRLYDVKRIEVLEGPQGTLYGAGSLGGVVRVVPNAPDLGVVGGQAWGGVQATQHGAPGGDGGAILNLPLVEDRLAVRVLGFGGIDGGYIDDRLRRLHDVNRVTTIGGRAALRYAPGNDWTIDLTALGQRIHGDDSQYADRDGLSRAGNVAQPYHNAYWLGEMVVSKRWGKTVWTSSFGYADQRVFEQFEGPRLDDITRPDVQPALDAQPTVFSQDNHIRLRSAETRLARRGSDGAGWLVGISLLSNRASVRREMGEASARAPLTGLRNAVDEATLYGEYGVTPTSRTTLTLGGRITRSWLTGESQDVEETVALRIDPEARARRRETRFLPAASLSWRPADGIVAFVRYQQGFRPGGIAIRQNFIQRFQGDRVETTEIGGRVGRRRFDMALTLSHTRWQNVQADLVDGFGFPTTANIGDGRIRSVGWSGKWRPVNGLELEAALYLNDSHITPAYAILPFTIGRIDQTRLPNVADRSGRIGIAYSGWLRSGQRLDLSGFARYIGKSTLGIGTILGRPQGDYLDTGIELRLGNDRRGISIAATNLLDSRGNRFALGSPFLVREQNQITPLQPRSIRLGVDVRF
jgi:iron complex outermembrane recepter protein